MERRERKHSRIHSGISSRPLSVAAMIATCFAEDHDLKVRDLDGLEICKVGRRAESEPAGLTI